MRIVVALVGLLAVTVTASSARESQWHSRDQARVASAINGLADSPAKFVIYSLRPWPRPRDESGRPERVFHGYHVLGQAEISDAKERRRLAQALARGARENDSMLANCFEPRHGLHIEQSGRSVDLVICFECLRGHAYGFPPDSEFLTSASPQPTFDDSLRRHQLRLAPK